MDTGTPRRFYGGAARYRTKNFGQQSWNSRGNTSSQVPHHAYGPGDVLEVYEGGSTPESPFGHPSIVSYMGLTSFVTSISVLYRMAVQMKEES